MEVRKDSKIVHGMEVSEKDIEGNRVDEIRDKIELETREIKKKERGKKRDRSTNREDVEIHKKIKGDENDKMTTKTRPNAHNKKKDRQGKEKENPKNENRIEPKIEGKCATRKKEGVPKLTKKSNMKSKKVPPLNEKITKYFSFKNKNKETILGENFNFKELKNSQKKNQ